MSYTVRVWLSLALLLGVGAGSVGALLAAASGMAANDLHVGKGHSKFPPQKVLRMSDGREVAPGPEATR
jgi:hypothetical protein